MALCRVEDLKNVSEPLILGCQDFGDHLAHALYFPDEVQRCEVTHTRSKSKGKYLNSQFISYYFIIYELLS